MYPSSPPGVHFEMVTIKLELSFSTTQRLVLSDCIAGVEKRIILETLKYTAWNRSRAAFLLGVNRTTLIAKMHRHGLMEDS